MNTCLVYFDETGDDGANTLSSNQFVLTSIYMQTDTWQENFNKIRNCRKELKDRFGFHISEEIHTKHLVRDKGFYRSYGWTDQQRRDILIAFTKCIASLDLKIINVIIDKTKIRTEDYCVLEKALTYNIQRIDNDSHGQWNYLAITDKGRLAPMRKTARAIRAYNPVQSHFGGYTNQPIKGMVEDIMEKGEKSKYLDWYYIEKFPLESERGEIPNYKCFGYYGGMPKLNLKNPEVEKFFTDVACYWIKECDIDGWRMDVGDEISHYFWKNFRRAVKAVKKDMLIIGEIWHYAGDFLEGDEWDTVMNYPFYLNLIDLLADEKINVSQFIQNLGYLKGRLNKKCYPLMWNLIDSHDTARFLHLCKDNKKKQHLAAAFQLLLPGMPMIYYGDEFAMPGANDPDCRRGMYWDEEYQDKEMFEWYKQLLKVRKNHACIVEGEPMEIAARDEEETIVLTRKNGEETLALIFNCSSSARVFHEYAQKYDLLREKPFDGKIEGLDAAVIVL